MDTLKYQMKPLNVHRKYMTKKKKKMTVVSIKFSKP